MKKFFNYFLIGLLFVLFNAFQSAFAIDVVYPKSLTPNIYAKSTFFVGNVGAAREFYINDVPVKLYKEGVFVYVVPLEFGKNYFTLKSVSENGDEQTLVYRITRPEPVKHHAKTILEASESTEYFEDYIKAEIIRDNVPLRADVSGSSKRLTHLNKGAVLFLDACNENYCRVYGNESTRLWIKKSDFSILEKVAEPEIANIKRFKYSYDKNFEYFSFKTNRYIPYQLKESQNGVNVIFYNVLSSPAKLEKYVQNIIFKDNTLSFFVPHQKLWGYDCYYDGTNMVFRLRRAVNVDTHTPLKNIVIALDAGHGGKDGGAIGPTRVREADIVLDITLRLRDILRKEGAKVIMTREDNEYVGLYDRIDKIKAAAPLFSISIHANALPDGADPFVRYGTSVYYYNAQAKEFADTLKQTIVGQLGTRDDGTRYASFVLNRETLPISVLLETAYMINPTDYENLLNSNFRQKIAQSVADGIKFYLNAAVPK